MRKVKLPGWTLVSSRFTSLAQDRKAFAAIKFVAIALQVFKNKPNFQGWMSCQTAFFGG